MFSSSEDAVAREEDAPVKVKLNQLDSRKIGLNGKLGRKHTLGFRQLLFQIRNFFFMPSDTNRLAQGDAAL
jgi:hypothetical protein